ncbi:MAG TPA: hypothetical protein VG871_16600 [Vicinamibacterales bacterium]|nr:hypothetical protein [Vicinamibacterales bacterium]
MVFVIALVRSTSRDAVHAATTGTIGVNFVGSGYSLSTSDSAGVLATSHWNNASGASRSSPLAVLDDTGGVTGVTVTWTADNTWNLPVNTFTANRRLMRGYLDTINGHTTTVNVAGLAGGAYDIYVYADGDNGRASRSATYQISGPGLQTTSAGLTDSANTNFNTSFVQANGSSGNYVRFSVAAATAFTLSAVPGQASDGVRRAPINGLQIVPTGPPSPDFTISAAPSSNTVVAGGSATYTVSVGAVS